MTRTSLLILFSFIALMCSNKKKVSINKFDEKFYTSGKLDPCDCNTKSVDLINRSIKTRKSFSSIKELKSNKKAKQHISKIAKVYVKLAEKCFEKNATNLFIPSDCMTSSFWKENKTNCLLLELD